MEAKGIIQSDMHIKIVKVIRIWGHKSIYGPLKVLNVGLQDYLGPQSTSQDLLSSSGDVTVLHGPGPSPMVPGHNVQKTSNWSCGPPVTPEKLGSGGEIGPGGLQ
ncbi:hypothetical protein O181_030058 [Austropuccinia psidii MF-1]|uniref:Uncharacterized protein n=1 Tax=Austropuccinia psidii MF-1 TaxID=1389203 RepID=A0A9Q3H3B9_9BASI|nr:hypothetical protein [Austropuccinia psidii MF-1]